MLKAIAAFVDAVSVLRIIAAPVLIAAFIALFIYFGWPSIATAILAALLILVGLVIGILWARRVTKKESASAFMAHVETSPDIDAAVREKNN
jgi:hypothetical protein